MVEMCGEIVQELRKKEYFIQKIQNLVDISQTVFKIPLQKKMNQVNKKLNSTQK